MRNKYTEMGTRELYEGLVACAASMKNPVAGAATTFIFVNKVYGGLKYNSWNVIYKKFSKKYAKVCVVFRWGNGGKNSGYIPHKETVEYVSKK